VRTSTSVLGNTQIPPVYPNKQKPHIKTTINLNILSGGVCLLDSSDSEYVSSAAVAQISGAKDVRMEQVTGLPMLSINPQREHLTLLGLDIATLQNA